MNKKDFFPIFVVSFTNTENDGIRFFRYDKQIDFPKETAPIILEIMKYCDGFHSINQISNSINKPIKYVSNIISELQNLELITDSNEQYLHFHRISSFPTLYYPNLSQEKIRLLTEQNHIQTNNQVFEYNFDTDSSLFSIRNNRYSCRNFSDKPLSIDQIGSICNYAYNIKEHSVPSGGGLYPLKIYIIVCKDQINIKSGYYEYDHVMNKLILLKKDVNIEYLKFCFNDITLPFNSSLQVIISADISKQSIKYGNRAYRLALLEAGHAAENILLYCAEKKLATCELGGILDFHLMSELNTKEFFPLLGISIGYPSTVYNRINELEFVEKFLRKPQGPIRNVKVNTFGKHSSFFLQLRNLVIIFMITHTLLVHLLVMQYIRHVLKVMNAIYQINIILTFLLLPKI